MHRLMSNNTENIVEMTNNFCKVLINERHVMSHIECTFKSISLVSPETDRFMQYYLNQILRLDTFGTIDGEFALQLKKSGLAQLLPLEVDGYNPTFVCAGLSETLHNLNLQVKNRIKLMNYIPPKYHEIVKDYICTEWHNNAKS